MNTSKTEFLSAFLDDEAGDFERRRLTDELTKDEELGAALSRYSLIGEAMRAGEKQTMGMADNSLLSRIHAELEDEPTYDQPLVEQPTPQQAPRPYRNWGMGIAATVAALAVGGVLFMQPGDNTDNSAQLAQATAVESAAPVSTASTVTVPSEPTQQLASADERIRQLGQVNPQARDILKQYVAKHVKYASTTAIAPSIRAVSYANE